ncbi:MAG: Maf family protein [Anaerolineales bacterium]|nr:Maf family protein [Anaerolineales bacterium]
MNQVKLILASSSPRRRQLFALGGWDFDALSADADETPLVGETPREYVVRLAKAKALAIQPQVESGALILGSDTTVADDGEILGKPPDPADAIRMLKRLRGRTHQVYTAIAALQNETLIADLSVSEVTMREYADDEIEAYVQTGDPLDKAGAYAIQHAAFHPVAAMDGCYAGVMGLPMCRVVRLLRRFGVEPIADVRAACRDLLGYDCEVWDKEIV